VQSVAADSVLRWTVLMTVTEQMRSLKGGAIIQKLHGSQYTSGTDHSIQMARVPLYTSGTDPLYKQRQPNAILISVKVKVKISLLQAMEGLRNVKALTLLRQTANR
jgi:hypothetical protein